MGRIDVAGVPVPGDMIVISKKEHERLINRDEEYAALEAAGVDNWSGMEFVQWPNREED